MSEASPKQKLMVARQQLDKLSIFIANLADFFHGASPAIDGEFQQIKKLLSGKPDYENAVQISVGLSAKLKKESKLASQKNASTLLQIQTSLRHLTELDVVEDTVKKEIKQFMGTLLPDANNKSAPLAKFETALNLFKKALSNDLTSGDSNDKIEKEKLRQQITQELRELIAPYYVKNKQDDTLIEINNSLNKGLDEKSLLECCLIIVRFVIKDVLQETSGATRVINDIHKSLMKVNQGIHSTIDKSKSLIIKRQQNNKAMKSQIIAIENTLSNTHDIADLKTQTTEYLAKLQNSLDMSEKKDKSEQEKVIALLQLMQNRLTELESKANSYKQQLLSQQVNSMTDSLTKLPNRMAYEEKVRNEWQRVTKSKLTVYMAILDIDNFKTINDKYGHSVGDKTLQIIASHMLKHLDKQDFLARWGGEEFVALLQDRDLNDSFKKLERLREKIAELPFMFKGTRVSVTISIGLTKFGTEMSISDTFEAADKLLYKAKQNGRNQTYCES